MMCIFLIFLTIGVSERVADIKTRNQAMKCLTAFAEAVGPRFVFERVRSLGVHFFYYVLF